MTLEKWANKMIMLRWQSGIEILGTALLLPYTQVQEGVGFHLDRH